MPLAPGDCPPLPRVLKQCQNCLKLGTDTTPLLSCACKRSHYCSKDCQKADWKMHKQICKYTRDTLDEMKNTNNSETSIPGVSKAQAEKLSKKWVQRMRSFLTWAVVNALELRAAPDRCLTHVLSMELSPTFTAQTFPHKDSEIRRAFSLKNPTVFSMKEFDEKIKPGVESLSRPAREKSLALRAQDPVNAIGYPIVILDAPAFGIFRVVPLGVEGPASALPPWESGWNQDFDGSRIEYITR